MYDDLIQGFKVICYFASSSFCFFALFIQNKIYEYDTNLVLMGLFITFLVSLSSIKMDYFKDPKFPIKHLVNPNDENSEIWIQEISSYEMMKNLNKSNGFIGKLINLINSFFLAFVCYFAGWLPVHLIHINFY